MKKWTSLTWDDLEEWAGDRSVARGRAYARQGRVQDLAASEDSKLLATVRGGRRYVASVWIESGKRGSLHSKCTCPVGYDGCKHAVAVVAAYLSLVGVRTKVPIVGQEDPRWADLAGENLDDGIAGDEEENGTYESGHSYPQTAGNGTRREWDARIMSHIQSKSREELADFVYSLAQRFPELHEEIRERIALGEGDIDRLVKEARRELQRVTSEPGWRNSWTGEGSVPDYTRLKHRLERLVELEHHDAVVRLGNEILERGNEQVGQSNDEGETGTAFAECLPIVFKAVVASSLPPHEKLLFAIDAHLKDEYSLIQDAADAVLEMDTKPGVWSAVADELGRRLEAAPTSAAADDFHRNYRRDRTSDWLIHALDKAGRSDEVLPICENEARRTGSYRRLVSLLIGHQKYDDAQRWAREGIENTWEKLPGIASQLAGALCNVARSRRKWDVVAAHAAWQFFDRPSRETYQELLDAAAKARCQEKVRSLALGFLETGVVPKGIEGCDKESKNHHAGWPLPAPDYLLPMLKKAIRSQSEAQPRYDVLIDLAIAEKHPEDVLRWYDALRSGHQQRDSGLWRHTMGGYADSVAAAVAHSHPQRSLEIYKQILGECLKETGQRAYETVAAYLRKMRPLLKSLRRQDEWTQLVADIRLHYRNRPRLMEMLDRLDGGPIVQTRR